LIEEKTMFSIIPYPGSAIRISLDVEGDKLMLAKIEETVLSFKVI